MRQVAAKLTVCVSLDGEQANIDLDTSHSIGDVIKKALLSFEVDEDHEVCHLAGPDRLYFPQENLGDTALGSGVMLTLRLPL